MARRTVARRRDFIVLLSDGTIEHLALELDHANHTFVRLRELAKEVIAKRRSKSADAICVTTVLFAEMEETA